MTTLIAKQYKAVEPVGRFAKGDIIGDLLPKQIEKLLDDGVIKAIEPVKPDAAKVEGKK